MKNSLHRAKSPPIRDIASLRGYRNLFPLCKTGLAFVDYLEPANSLLGSEKGAT